MSFLLLLGKKGPTYTLYDTFTTAAVAPLASPRTCEPIGTLTAVDTENKLSVSGGKLVCAGGRAAPDWGNPGFYAPSLARVAGLAVAAQWTRTGGTGGKEMSIGFSHSDAPPTYSQDLLVVGTGSGYDTDAYKWPVSDNVTYDTFLALRSVGGFLLMRVAGTSLYTLVGVNNVTNIASVRPGVSGNTAAFTLDNFRVLNLGTYDSRFASDYGLANSRLVTPAITTAFTHQADCLLETTFTWATATAFGLTFRQTDANNFWKVLADTDGSLKLIVTVASTPTTVANVAATFTNGQAYRVVVVAEGNKYTVFVNNVQKATYTDAGNNFLTGTNGTAATAGLSEVIAYPRFVILPAELG